MSSRLPQYEMALLPPAASLSVSSWKRPNSLQACMILATCYHSSRTATPGIATETDTTAVIRATVDSDRCWDEAGDRIR
ncbi:unnamed protein product [Arctogadus glacialis]